MKHCPTQKKHQTKKNTAHAKTAKHNDKKTLNPSNDKKSRQKMRKKRQIRQKPCKFPRRNIKSYKKIRKPNPIHQKWTKNRQIRQNNNKTVRCLISRVCQDRQTLKKLKNNACQNRNTNNGKNRQSVKKTGKNRQIRQKNGNQASNLRKPIFFC